MQIQIEFTGNNITLPLSYNYAVQGLIYNALNENPAYQEFLHNIGYVADEHCFRLFTFGALRGRYTVVNKSIIFERNFFLEIRTVDVDFAKLICQKFLPGNKFMLAGEEIIVRNIQIKDKMIISDSVRIKMLSPVVARITEDNKSMYFSPGEEMFLKIINKNFFGKYEAFTQKKPQSEITVYDVDSPRKVVSKYKGIWINGFMCEMSLSGESEYLNFLYNTGLGCKNSQGFGMFRVL